MYGQYGRGVKLSSGYSLPLQTPAVLQQKLALDAPPTQLLPAVHPECSIYRGLLVVVGVTASFAGSTSVSLNIFVSLSGSEAIPRCRQSKPGRRGPRPSVGKIGGNKSVIQQSVCFRIFDFSGSLRLLILASLWFLLALSALWFLWYPWMA